MTKTERAALLAAAERLENSFLHVDAQIVCRYVASRLDETPLSPGALREEGFEPPATPRDIFWKHGAVEWCDKFYVVSKGLVNPQPRTVGELRLLLDRVNHD